MRRRGRAGRRAGSGESPNGVGALPGEDVSAETWAPSTRPPCNAPFASVVVIVEHPVAISSSGIGPHDRPLNSTLAALPESEVLVIPADSLDVPSLHRHSTLR